MTTFMQCDVPGCTARHNQFASPTNAGFVTLTLLAGVAPRVHFDVCPEHAEQAKLRVEHAFHSMFRTEKSE